MKKIAVACDHAGPAYKAAIISHLTSKGYECTDLGTNSEESVNYPDYAKKVCDEITLGRCDCGILVCGTGIGMSIAANRRRGIRAAVCTTEDMARLCREHNDANILCLGARIIDLDTALRLCDIFVTEEFLGGRHKTRIDLIEDM